MDEEDVIAWQDVLDEIAAGRPGNTACPFCGHRPLSIDPGPTRTRISCPQCKKFIEGRFGS